MNGNTANTSSNYIHLQIHGQNYTKFEIKIRKHIPFRYLFNEYCKKVGIQKDTVKFLFDGRLLRKRDTAISLELEDNDVIETFEGQKYGIPTNSVPFTIDDRQINDDDTVTSIKLGNGSTIETKGIQN